MKKNIHENVPRCPELHRDLETIKKGYLRLNFAAVHRIYATRGSTDEDERLAISTIGLDYCCLTSSEWKPVTKPFYGKGGNIFDEMMIAWRLYKQLFPQDHYGLAEADHAAATEEPVCSLEAPDFFQLHQHSLMPLDGQAVVANP